MKFLIIEDELTIAQSLKTRMSELEGVEEIHIAGTFEEALNKINSIFFDFYLVDIMLDRKEVDGLDLCGEIKVRNPQAPIVVMTTFHSIDYLRRAMEVGANDYVTKPFNIEELLIRINRWTSPLCKEVFRGDVAYNELRYDSKKRLFFFKEEMLPLTKKNHELLLLFMQKPEHVLTKEYLREKYWGDYANTRKSRNIRSTMQLLRQSLEGTCSDWLQTVRGEGYILKK